MAVDYVILNKDNSENGIIAINKSVFKSIAEITIDDLDHAERAEKSSFSKAVIVRIADNKLKIETDIHVKYGANINATCEQVQNTIENSGVKVEWHKELSTADKLVGDADNDGEISILEFLLIILLLLLHLR